MKIRKITAFLLSSSMLLATVPGLAEGELSVADENSIAVPDEEILEFSEDAISEALVENGEAEFLEIEENDIVINSVYPENGAKNISVLDDVEIIFEEGSVVSEEDIEVTGENLPNYNIKIEDENVKIQFAKELPYNADVSVKIGNDTFTFKTERNPITTLFHEDFNGDAATSLARFEDVGTTETNFYEIFDGRLLMKSSADRNSNGGTPSIRARNNDILYIKGSENWGDYTLDVDVANGWYSRPEDNGEYYDVEAMMSVKTDKDTGNGVALMGRWLNPGKDAFFTIYALENYGVTGNYHGGWNVFDSQYRTIHHMTIDAIGTDVSFKFTGYDAEKSNRWKGAVAEGTRGGVTLRANWGRIVYDNVLVTDKGLLFTPVTLKNVKKAIELNFTESLDESAVEYIKVLKNGVDQNATVTLSDDSKTVYVDVIGLLAGERYTLSVGDEVMSADNTLISSEKNVLFTVSDDFGVLRFAPLDREQNVSILSDIKIELSQALSDSDIGEYISVYGMTKDKYDIKLTDEKIIDLIFKDALPYDSDIRVTVKKGLTSENGKVLENDVKWTFHTEKDTSDILYYQDFEDVTLDSTNLSVAENSTLKLGGATAKITAPECSCSDTANHDASCSVDYPWMLQVKDGYLAMKAQGQYSGLNKSSWNNNLKMIIDGSENWTDCKISADIWFPHNFGWVLFGLRDTDATDKHGVMFIGAASGTGTNDGDLQLYKTTSIAWNLIHLQGSEDILQSTWTNVSAEMAGNTVTYWQGAEDSATKHSWTSDEIAEKGGVWYAPGWSQSRIDNIMVIDMGLKFTPSTTKFTDGKMTLDFDEPMNTGNSPVVVFADEEGNEVNVAASWQDDRSIAIDAEGLKNGEIYTVTLKKDGIETLGGKPLASDKSFRVVADVPYYIENIKISDIVAGETVSANADITDYGKIDNASYMLVLAVFDEQGALYSIATDTKKNLEKGEKTTFNVTSASLPENIEGYRAECYIWDNMQDITHISGPVNKP